MVTLDARNWVCLGNFGLGGRHQLIAQVLWARIRVSTNACSRGAATLRPKQLVSR